MRIVIAAFVISACHGDPPPAAPVAPVSQCAKVADHLVTLMSASKHVAQDQLDPVRNMLSGHCDNDKWSAAVQQCALSASALDDLEKCKTLFTPEQESALKSDRAGRVKRDEEAPAVGGAPAADMSPPPPAEPAAVAPNRAPAQPAPKSSKKPGRSGGDPCEGGE